MLSKTLAKSPSGIAGLDEITGGGLPAGRPTLVAGGAGCGKTLLAVTFVVAGAVRYGEPGVIMSFEERAEEIAANVASLGFDLESLAAEGKLVIDHVAIERGETSESGPYDLEGLFIRLGHAIRSVGAKRVALDTIESLFAGLSDTAVLRAELLRLFRWLKEQGVTAVITGERGDSTFTRFGLEEYVSDCVIALDHRVAEQVSTRRLRIVKYRGSSHGTNEYPFIIDEGGVSVLPVTSLQLNHPVSDERVTSGVPELDAMLSGQGFYRGSSVLVSGSAGTGKSTLAAHFVLAACARGERCLYFAFEESPQQIMRNMGAVGIELAPCVAGGLLRFVAVRPTFWGLETHLARMHKEVEEFRPGVVVLDPMYNLVSVGSNAEVRSMLLRLVDHLKAGGITTLFVSLDANETSTSLKEEGVSSLMDTWIQLRTIEMGGERNRGIFVLKSRGMVHSNQIREFLITGKGVAIRDAYLGSGKVLTGSARLAQEIEQQRLESEQQQEMALRQRELERRKRMLQLQIAGMKEELEAQQDELSRLQEQQRGREQAITDARYRMARSRQVGGRS